MEAETACTSRNIPLPIQREVRQRCGFGCVICGLPLYEYEHMEEWATVKRHVAEEITLLCDQHHREKTGGMLPKEMVAEANKSPYNFKAGVKKPYDLHFTGKVAEINVGSNVFTCEDRGYGTAVAAIVVDNLPLVGFVLTDGHLLLNLVVFDEYNNKVLHIKNNQLFYTTIPWDIQLIGTTLTIREAHRKILLEIDFSPPNKITINKGRFLCNGLEILIRPTNILITNNSAHFSDNRTNNCHAGIVIGSSEQFPSCAIRMASVSRYTFDRAEALKFEKECQTS
ncbi:cell division protein [Pseudomonas sp. GL-RE-26]|uniref:cell division protein n=1 Tax=Pseudomonas sp. GL-RE-26 TaxID=2832390 RepID=UPI001CBB958C|nr:cell division protein [Pseudomonas sp. GL-RE-26]